MERNGTGPTGKIGPIRTAVILPDQLIAFAAGSEDMKRVGYHDHEDEDLHFHYHVIVIVDGGIESVDPGYHSIEEAIGVVRRSDPGAKVVIPSKELLL